MGGGERGWGGDAGWGASGEVVGPGPTREEGSDADVVCDCCVGRIECHRRRATSGRTGKAGGDADVAGHHALERAAYCQRSSLFPFWCVWVSLLCGHLGLSPQLWWVLGTDPHRQPALLESMWTRNSVVLLENMHDNYTQQKETTQNKTLDRARTSKTRSRATSSPFPEPPSAAHMRPPRRSSAGLATTLTCAR